MKRKYRASRGAGKNRKDVKRKRVRIPDLVCTTCGMRVESRAKTSRDLRMSHSKQDSERSWDYGMVPDDVIAFPICTTNEDDVWSEGSLENDWSYYHSRDRANWGHLDHINYFLVSTLQSTPHNKSAKKGSTEGSETYLEWDSIFSSRDGEVEYIKDNNIVAIKRSYDNHVYPWQNNKKLPLLVSKGDQVRNGQVIASKLKPINDTYLACKGFLPPNHIYDLLKSPSRTQRFTGFKIARHNHDMSFKDLAIEVISHKDEDIYVVLEGSIYLAVVHGESILTLINKYLSSSDNQERLEGVVALSETGNPESVSELSKILHNANEPFFLRSAASWALGHIGSEDAASALVEAFEDIKTELRQEALTALSGMKTLPEKLMVDKVTNGPDAIGYGAAEVIRRNRDISEGSVDKLLESVKDGTGREWVVWLLANLPKDEWGSHISSLQSSAPESHYAISVLWSFLDSWISKRWEAHYKPNHL